MSQVRVLFGAPKKKHSRKSVGVFLLLLNTLLWLMSPCFGRRVAAVNWLTGLRSRCEMKQTRWAGRNTEHCDRSKGSKATMFLTVGVTDCHFLVFLTYSPKSDVLGRQSIIIRTFSFIRIGSDYYFLSDIYFLFKSKRNGSMLLRLFYVLFCWFAFHSTNSHWPSSLWKNSNMSGYKASANVSNASSDIPKINPDDFLAMEIFCLSFS